MSFGYFGGCCPPGYHQPDLSWLIEEILKTLTGFGKLEEDFQELKDYVNNYFKNLNLNEEVQAAIDALVDDGTIESILTAIVDNMYQGDTGNYRNSNLVKQIVYGTAMSYFMNAWTTVNPDITYGNSVGRTDGKGTALDTGVTDCSLMDCSTFVLLCLLGIPYSDSPYNGKQLRSYGALGFDRQFIPTVNNDTGLIRWAYEILLYGAYNRCLYDVSSLDDLSDIQTGDVVFFCWNDEYVNSQPADWWGKNTYEHCAHVGIAVSDCSAFPSGVGIVQAVSTSALTNFRDLKEYAESLTNQHFYPKVMRPRLNASNVYLNKLWRFRGDINSIPVVLTSSGKNYSGGRLPANMVSSAVSKTDGSLSANNTRYTTFFIPYNISMFIDGTVSNIGWNWCYFTEDEEYIQYNSGGINRAVTNCAFVRIEFFTRNGSDMTSEEKGQIQSLLALKYHDWCDNMQSLPNTTSSDIQYLDTLIYFDSVTEVLNQVVLNGV